MEATSSTESIYGFEGPSLYEEALDKPILTSFGILPKELSIAEEKKIEQLNAQNPLDLRGKKAIPLHLRGGQEKLSLAFTTDESGERILVPDSVKSESAKDAWVFRKDSTDNLVVYKGRQEVGKFSQGDFKYFKSVLFRVSDKVTLGIFGFHPEDNTIEVFKAADGLLKYTPADPLEREQRHQRFIERGRQLIEERKAKEEAEKAAQNVPDQIISVQTLDVPKNGQIHRDEMPITEEPKEEQSIEKSSDEEIGATIRGKLSSEIAKIMGGSRIKDTLSRLKIPHLRRWGPRALVALALSTTVNGEPGIKTNEQEVLEPAVNQAVDFVEPYKLSEMQSVKPGGNEALKSGSEIDTGKEIPKQDLTTKTQEEEGKIENTEYKTYIAKEGDTLNKISIDALEKMMLDEEEQKVPDDLRRVLMLATASLNKINNPDQINVGDRLILFSDRRIKRLIGKYESNPNAEVFKKSYDQGQGDFQTGEQVTTESEKALDFMLNL